jgi:hypothetical protein
MSRIDTETHRTQTIGWLRAAELAAIYAQRGLAARTGGASIPKRVWRVTFWGALAMAITAGVGRLFGVAA